MKTLRASSFAAIAACLSLDASAWAAESSAPGSAAELAGKLSALQQDGGSYVRLRMEINGGSKETLQLQIKQRRTKNASDVVYQVLFPKERKGESVLLRKSGNRMATGSVVVPPNSVRTIDDPQEPLFGSDLSYEDVVEDFFAWDQQAIVGTEEVGGVNCQILESKPGKGERSSYGSVRSWIDTRRLLPLRVEKYAGGQLVRRIETTRVVSDAGHQIPANLRVMRARSNSSTDLDGSRIKHGIEYSDRDFSIDALKDLAPPRGQAAE